jgi:hypothetical protein
MNRVSQPPVRFTAGTFNERIRHIYSFFFAILDAATDTEKLRLEKVDQNSFEISRASSLNLKFIPVKEDIEATSFMKMLRKLETRLLNKFLKDIRESLKVMVDHITKE